MNKLSPMHGLLAIITIFFGFYTGSLAWSLGAATVDKMEQQESEQLCVDEMVKEGYTPDQIQTSQGICYLKVSNEPQSSLQRFRIPL